MKRFLEWLKSFAEKHPEFSMFLNIFLLTKD